ncbi:formylglycine-generating enzyme family protein [Cohnella thailandensis]|uniref:SUMF1/EgtB/PvdO family nonheme iron enzyme n=1 Tax=Cohnella thailandensis TaxID=557557 RepID=A0A841SZN8_9BACL|nr:SUMF1/EgtB/PvdO family nonheme iron enzyme [Cohnella thailandensis]MBB6635715.1 SUMF1/EgtB/PvdO family nonheme iron enzyme [Cohnella thailandensis]MBP1976091.1 formylglycine-generating enzyme required for sulfatase activity [Cohnella thailandensis]
MRKPVAVLLLAATVLMGACSHAETGKKAQAAEAEKHEPSDSLVFVQGGSFVHPKSNYSGSNVTLKDFYIGRYEVTQQEWMEVMGSNPSAFQGDNLPVEMVSWYDAVEYCNRRSLLEGLTPYYRIDKSKQDPNNKSEYDTVKWTVTIDEEANGYRLPTEEEWEYAAGGGQLSKSYLYSGSDEADEVAWYWRNSGKEYLTGDWTWPAIENNRNRTQAIGNKKANELGLYDMSGNVREWTWDWYGENAGSVAGSGSWRVVKGGGWMGDVSNNEVSFRGKFEANGFGPDQGFRVSRGE